MFLKRPNNNSANIANNSVGSLTLNSIDSEYFRGKNQVTGGYKNLEILGGGSFGKVFRVECDKTSIQYALKLLTVTEYQKNPKALKYIATEADILKNLKNGPQHPHIVNIHDVLDDLTYVFELCNNDSLKKYIDDLRSQNSQPFPEDNLRTIFLQVLSALQFLHVREKPIIHRDLKPANILAHQVNGRFIFKISDFGFAKSSNKVDEFISNVGSKYFMAPEVGSRKYSLPADIYSLGVIMYYLARSSIGDAPKPQNAGYAMMLLKPFSVEFKNIIVSMMAEEPSQRPTIEKIAMSEWVQTKKIPIIQAGVETTSMLLRDLYSIHQDITKIPENKMLLVSYYDSDRLHQLVNTSIRPLYTVEKVYLVDRKTPLNPLVFPPIEQISKNYLSSKNKNVWSIHNYSQDFSAISNQFNLTYDRMNDAGIVQKCATNVLIRTEEQIRLYILLSEYYFNQINQPELKQSIQTFEDNNKAVMQHIITNLKSLKDVDKHGNDVDSQLIDRIPFIKSFNLNVSSNYDIIVNSSKYITDCKQYHHKLQDLVSKLATEAAKLSGSFNNTLEGMRQNQRQMETERATNKSYGFVFETGHMINSCNACIEQCYNWYVDVFARMNTALIDITNQYNELVKSLINIESILHYSSDNQLHTALLEDIKAIPEYLTQYKTEIKERDEYLKQYAQLQSRQSAQLNTLIVKETARRMQFEGIPTPKYFVPIELPEGGLDNPLAQFLPEGASIGPVRQVTKTLGDLGFGFVADFSRIGESFVFSEMSNSSVSYGNQDGSVIHLSHSDDKITHIFQNNVDPVRNTDADAGGSNSVTDQDFVGLKKQVDFLNTNNLSKDSEINQLKKQIEDLKNNSNSNTNSVKVDGGQKDQELSELKAQLAAIALRSAEKERENSELQKMVNDFRSRHKEYESAFNQGQEVNKSLAKRIQEIVDKEVALQITHDEDKERMSNDFSKRAKRLKEEILQLREQNTAVANRNSELLSELREKEDAIRTISDNVASADQELVNENNKLRAENAKLEERKKSLKEIVKILHQQNN